MLGRKEALETKGPASKRFICAQYAYAVSLRCTISIKWSYHHSMVMSFLEISVNFHASFMGAGTELIYSEIINYRLYLMWIWTGNVCSSDIIKADKVYWLDFRVFLKNFFFFLKAILWIFLTFFLFFFFSFSLFLIIYVAPLKR